MKLKNLFKKEERPNILRLLVTKSFDSQNGRPKEQFLLDISPELKEGEDSHDKAKIGFCNGLRSMRFDTSIERHTAVALHRALTHALMTGKSYEETL